MLSYRHGFHAGNFADVHKHVAMVLLLDHLRAKHTPFCVVDTHAGAGRYDLASTFTRKLREFERGWLRVATHADPPPAVRRYLEVARAAGTADARQPGLLCRYPGSPLLARALLRPGDRMVLAELHPTDALALRALFRDDRQVAVHHRDGFEALPGFVPPRERRGLVLMDPSYELRDEFVRATQSLLAAWHRWPTGIYLVWHPLQRGQPVAVFHRKLVRGGLRKVLAAELHVGPGSVPGRLTGSGLVVVNPPWAFAERLQEASGWLAAAMAEEDHAPPRVRWLAPE